MQKELSDAQDALLSEKDSRQLQVSKLNAEIEALKRKLKVCMCIFVHVFCDIMCMFCVFMCMQSANYSRQLQVSKLNAEIEALKRKLKVCMCIHIHIYIRTYTHQNSSQRD